MRYPVGTRVFAVDNGVDFGMHGRGAEHNYGKGWVGVVHDGNVIHFENGRIISGCDHRNFREHNAVNGSLSQWGERTR